MPVRKYNEYLDTHPAEEDDDSSSVSETAADSRTERLTNHRSKRQKLTAFASKSEDETHEDGSDRTPANPGPTGSPQTPQPSSAAAATGLAELPSPAKPPPTPPPKRPKPLTPSAGDAATAPKPGVIYLSRIPPFMRPSTVRTLLSVHGPITRLFLTPEAPIQYLSRRKAGGNRKRSYIDGWVEFAKKRDAKVCVDAINGQIVGGKKGGWYRDDVWNAKYLKGFGWGDLMDGVRGEEREREERVRVGVGREGRERGEFLRNVERAKVEETRRKKVRKNDGDGDGDGDGATDEVLQGKANFNRFERRFRQNEVKHRKDKGGVEEQSDEVKRVLGKIF